MIEPESHANVSDEDFLKGIHPLPRDRELALVIRRVIGEWCGIPPESLSPDQQTAELHERMKSGWARGWDETGFLIKLEEALRSKIDMKVKLPAFADGRFLFWSMRGPKNLGVWIGEAVKALER